jgi:hypothetical protein
MYEVLYNTLNQIFDYFRILWRAGILNQASSWKPLLFEHIFTVSEHLLFSWSLWKKVCSVSVGFPWFGNNILPGVGNTVLTEKEHDDG